MLSTIHFTHLQMHCNCTSIYQFPIEYWSRDQDGVRLPLTPLIVVSLLLTTYLIQIYSKSISDLFCLSKSYQLSSTRKEEYETWGFLISHHRHLMTTKNASHLLLLSIKITNTEAKEAYLYYHRPSSLFPLCVPCLFINPLQFEHFVFVH